MQNNQAARKPHLSPSSLDTFCRCGEQWRRRYIEGEKIPPGIAALKGKGFHGAAQANMDQKLQTRQDLTVEQIKEIAAEKFEAESKGGYVLTPDEEKRGRKNVIGRAKDDVVEMAGFHAEHQAPDYQPVLVEKRVRIELPMCSHDLEGVIDLADELDRVIDFKTSGRSKNQSDADNSVQLTTYAAMFQRDNGRPPSEVRLDTVVTTTTKRYRSVVTSLRTMRDIEVLAARMNAVVMGITKGVFAPASPGSWWCNEKWCGYARTCPYYNAERQAAAGE